MRKLLLSSTALAVALAAAPVLAQQASSAVCAPGTTIPNQPGPAALAGYNTLTFGPNITVGQNWFPDTQDTGQMPNITANADGSLTVAGGADTWNAQMETGWNAGANGEAFGGGFYAQATIAVPGATSCLASFDNCGNDTGPGNQWPSWWATSENGTIETDFVEIMDGTAGQYGSTVINWADNPHVGYGQTVTAPNGNTLHGQNTYGFLWIPATATSGGSITFFFNGNQVVNPITWTQDNPGTYGIIDGQRMILRFGAGANSPATFSDIQVWQASTADNTINGQPAPAIAASSSSSVSNPTAQAACEAAQTAATTPVTAAAPATPAATPSAQASTATPGGAGQSLTDSAGNAWAITAAGTVTVNGKPAAYTADVSQIVNVNGVVYQETTFGGWWAWDGTGWVGVSGDPTQATVTVTTVADATGQNYSIAQSGSVLIDGSLAPATQTAAESAAEADFQANAAAVQAKVQALTTTSAPQDAQAEATLALANALLQRVQATLRSEATGLTKGTPAQ